MISRCLLNVKPLQSPSGRKGQGSKHAGRPFSAVRRSLTLRLDGFARSRGALQDPHQGKAPNAKNPAAVGRRRAAGPQPPWGAARRRRTARGAGGRWAAGGPPARAHIATTKQHPPTPKQPPHLLGARTTKGATIFPEIVLFAFPFIGGGHTV